MVPFSWPSCYFKTRPPSCPLTQYKRRCPGQGRDLMTYVSDNYTSYSAPSSLMKKVLVLVCRIWGVPVGWCEALLSPLVWYPDPL